MPNEAEKETGQFIAQSFEANDSLMSTASTFIWLDGSCSLNFFVWFLLGLSGKYIFFCQNQLNTSNLDPSRYTGLNERSRCVAL